MEIQNEDHGIGGRVEEEFEIEKPRVRLPVVTKGIFNPVAITRLQDQLEDTKKELLKLRAQEPSKDELVVPKTCCLTKLMEMFPRVGDQVTAMLDQKLRVSREEYEAKIKQLEDDQRDIYSQITMNLTEIKLIIHKVENTFKELDKTARTHPNAPIGDAWARVEDGTCDRSRRGIIEPKVFRESVSTIEPRDSQMTTPNLLSFDSPFRNNKWANTDSLKRKYDGTAQPDLGRNFKRSKILKE